MIIYAWNCTRVDAYPVEDENSDVVYNVHYQLAGVDTTNTQSNGNSYQAYIVGTQMLDTSTITEFIPFEDLTNEIVTAWVITAMGTEAVDAIKLGIVNQIDAQVNPTSLSLIIGQPIPSTD